MRLSACSKPKSITCASVAFCALWSGAQQGYGVLSSAVCCLQRVRRSGRARRAVTFANDSDSEPEDVDMSDSGWSGDDKELRPTRRSSLGRLIRNPRVRIVQGGQGALHAVAVMCMLQSPASLALHTLVKLEAGVPAGACVQAGPVELTHAIFVPQRQCLTCLVFSHLGRVRLACNAARCATQHPAHAGISQCPQLPSGNPAGAAASGMNTCNELFCT